MFNCWISYAQVLLSPNLCFVFCLNLDLYVLGDDALISYGSSIRTKSICVLIHIRIKDEVGAIKDV